MLLPNPSTLWFISKGIALVQFTAYDWTPARRKHSLIHPLGFSDWLFMLMLAKYNLHKILCFPIPPRSSPCQEVTASVIIIWKKCTHHWFFSHFGSAVTAQSVCHTTPETLAPRLLGPSWATDNNENSHFRKCWFHRPFRGPKGKPFISGYFFLFSCPFYYLPH